MCGICGFTDQRNEPLLRAMTGSLRHRGPDEDGFFASGDKVSLGMRRLKIIDLATGSQPVSNEDGTVVTVFNGEIYNFKGLRAELESKGHRFRTRSDTEVLVHLYEEYGANFPSRLRGMFAFAIWDSRTETLMLARDQFGIKPLYYSLSGGKLRFASELKALRLVPGVCGELDHSAIDHYFTRLYIPAPLTVYRGVNKLEPASVLIFRNGAAKTEKYWRLPVPDGRVQADEFYAENIRSLLSLSVKEQLISEVPLGLLLSGGIDSSALLAFMTEHSGAGVKAFTAGFGGGDFDESARARSAAKRFAAEHIEIPVLADIGGVIKTLAAQFDEPFADSSALAHYLVTKEARRHVTVAIAGTGGDEIFGGYPRHLGARLLPAYLCIPAPLRRLAAGAAGAFPESRSPYNFPGRFKRFLRGAVSDFGNAYGSWMSYLTPEEKNCFYSDAMRTWSGGVSPMSGAFPAGPDDIFGYELGSYLPDDLLCLADRASMANSLELRVPFMDTRLAEFMAGVPLSAKTRGFRLKYLLKKAMAGRLGPEILNGPKRGFQVPLAAWQEKELKSFTREVLSPAAVKKAGVLSAEGVERILAEHSSGRRNRYDLIHAASVFHLWLEQAAAALPVFPDRARNIGRARKILLVNLAGLGDIVMMSPALRAIRSSYPDAVVELLTIERSRDLAAGLPGLDEVHSVPIHYRLPGPAGVLALIKTLLALRRKRFDVLVNFSLISSSAGLWKARLINRLVRPGTSSFRVLKGLGSAGNHCVFEEPVEKKSEVELTARLLPCLGVEVRDTEIVYAAGAVETRKVASDLAARRIVGRPLIGLNPGAFRPSRRWPLENWKILTRLLLEKYPGAALIVTGSAFEIGLADELKISGRVFSAAGMYTLKETAALCAMTDVFISNDTGPMHLAAAAGAKTVGIFGPGDRWRFSPSVPAARVRVLGREVPGCQLPCYKFKCSDPVCLSAISPKEVLEAAADLLSPGANQDAG